ncbi:MAG: gamma-glutamylcyclotransferase [Bradymonadales bacterium]|nr:gamma-glutamylcyclotransferase [Bradymonadales bacterium]
MYQPRYQPQISALLFIDGPADPAPDYLAGKVNLFVCGALQDPARMSALVGRSIPFAPAVCLGFRRITRRVGDREVPLMVADLGNPSRVLTGVVWLDLSGSEVRAVETLELEGNLRKPVAVQVMVGELLLDAITYIGC